MLLEGNAAPAWTGSDQAGVRRSSDEYAGSWLLLYFYPEDDTPGCTTEACGFRDQFRTFQGRATIVGVSADGIDSHKKFSEKYHLPFTLIADPDKQIMTAYGAGTDFRKRVTFLINPAGVIEKIYQGFDVKEHADVIDGDLRALGV